MGASVPRSSPEIAAYHCNMVEVVDQEDGPEFLGLEGAWQLHEQIHAGVPHPVQVVVQLPILHDKELLLLSSSSSLTYDCDCNHKSQSYVDCTALLLDTTQCIIATVVLNCS